jgi:hypothetical protein
VKPLKQAAEEAKEACRLAESKVRLALSIAAGHEWFASQEKVIDTLAVARQQASAVASRVDDVTLFRLPDPEGSR